MNIKIFNNNIKIFIHSNIKSYTYIKIECKNKMIYAFVQIFDKNVIKLLESTYKDTKKPD